MGSIAHLTLWRIGASVRVPDAIPSLVCSYKRISESLGDVRVHEKAVRLRPSFVFNIPYHHLSLSPGCVPLSTECYRNTLWDLSVREQQCWHSSMKGLSHTTQLASQYTSGSYLWCVTPKLSPPAHSPPFLSLCVFQSVIDSGCLFHCHSAKSHSCCCRGCLPTVSSLVQAWMPVFQGLHLSRLSLQTCQTSLAATPLPAILTLSQAPLGKCPDGSHTKKQTNEPPPPQKKEKPEAWV